MKAPTTTLSKDHFPPGTKTARIILAYLLRAVVRAIRAKAARGTGISRDRVNSLSSEVETVIVYSICSERSVLEFFRSVCQRFDVTAAGEFDVYGALEAWIPSATGDEYEGAMPWITACAALDYRDLRRVVTENPQLLANIACARPHQEQDGDDLLRLERQNLDSFEDVGAGPCFVPTLPATLIQPQNFRTVWTLTSPMSHGADSKAGNVTLFRRHQFPNPLTGELVYVLFVAGNAVRGLLRDLAMRRWCQLLEIDPVRDLPGKTAQALFAGGGIDKGADTAGTNLTVRRTARAMCPPWDLLGGCMDQQPMGGRLRVHDAKLVCRENAWIAHEWLGVSEPLEDFAARLPLAADCTELRYLTRQKHADFEDPDGIQMITQTEVLKECTQMLHSFQVYGIDGVPELTLSCLSDLLSDFRAHGVIGGGASRGLGLVAFDPYQPGPLSPELPGPEPYLQYCTEHREEMRGWAMGNQQASSRPAKRGRGKTATTPTEDL